MAASDLDQLIGRVLQGQAAFYELTGIDRERMAQLAELAYMYFQEGRYEEARIVFEGLLSLEPNHAYYCRALGTVFHRLGRHDTAVRYYQRAVKLDENEPEAWANMGEALLVQGQVEQAIGCLERADALYLHFDPANVQRKRVRTLLRNYRPTKP